ncbi:helix-turn-helix domain-containing protein [Hydrogenophaga intermedia]|uniref:helix-turn-helix domain-containing protein n=1 Tax=Hydrogenophaga intermedia TaxID=65786 RepID=UPI00204350A8|nr:helix-turn-helix domain-containing protein [Hydrogenophaga intermedia]MCM3565718.1 helix-turn-helix domain-containing protein [Hydrogenophaga intermedia]
MKRARNRIPSDENNRWYEGYGEGGFFCLPRKLLFNVADSIDNATLYVYVALASCHYEGNTTYAGPYLAKVTGKDERAIRLHLSDLETLGLIRREPLGQGFRILFECPDRERIRQGVLAIEARKQERLRRRQAAKASKGG